VSVRRRYVRNPWPDRALVLEFVAELEEACPMHWIPLQGRQRKWCSRWCWYEWSVESGAVLDWAWTRSLVLERDHWTCQNCGRKAANGQDLDETGNTILEVDHTIEIQDGGPEFDPANLRTLCRACHLTKTNARRHWKSSRMAEAALRGRVDPLSLKLEVFA
jgi:5-methylcytosine-specific restriction endonuclease McrA